MKTRYNLSVTFHMYLDDNMIDAYKGPHSREEIVKKVVEQRLTGILSNHYEAKDIRIQVATTNPANQTQNLEQAS